MQEKNRNTDREERLYRRFAEYAAIPHPSGNTAAASEYCLEAAASAGYRGERDAAGNLLIRVPGAQGRSDRPTVILQGHLDMVAVREEGSERDPAQDPLDLFWEGDRIGARGTSLGGDDGVAVAMCLALLEEKEAPHPPLEILLTADEEIGLLGASALDMSRLKGRLLLNLDSEEEGVFIVGCAGGVRLDISMPVCRTREEMPCLHATLYGGRGGHSGNDIHRGRLNAAVGLSGLLRSVSRAVPLFLCCLDGGEKDNAIPDRASAYFLTPDPEKAIRVFREAAEALCASYREADPSLSFAIGPASGGRDAGAERCADPAGTGRATEDCASDGVGISGGRLALTAEESRRWLDFLSDAPCGVQAMREDFPDIVHTSLNLGILRSGSERMHAVYAIRSASEAGKAELADTLSAAARAIGAEVHRRGEYPAWEYRPDSRLRPLMQRIWRAQTGRPAREEIIHAGLECGIFAARLPGLDCVSLGPALYDIHTARERLSFSSLVRTYDYLLAVLAEL